MLQIVATLVSLLVAFGAVAIIAATIAGDWNAMVGALGLSPAVSDPLPQSRARMARRARVLRVRRQVEPLRAAA